MDSDTPLDYALFQLSPGRSRCELFVLGDGKREKLASGLLKPFTAHLKVVEEQAAQSVQSIRLEVEHGKNTAAWFNKGTLERFVRFVSAPEVLESVNTFDDEMSQLEGARRLYLQGIGDQPLGASGENKATAAEAADVTKKELLRAIDLRLATVKKDLITACVQASATGFTLDNVSELLLFAECFGACRLNEACTKFISLCQWRPELISHQHQPLQEPPSPWRGFSDENLHSSGSDMSIDEPELESTVSAKPSISNANRPQCLKPCSSSQPPPLSQQSASEPPSTFQQSKTVLHCVMEKGKVNVGPATSGSQVVDQPTGEGGLRRLSLKDRINFFESKQKEQLADANSITGAIGGSGINRATIGKAELRRLPSDSSMEKSVLRRWSGDSDRSVDLNNNGNRKESGIAAGTPTSCASYQAHTRSNTEEKESECLKDPGILQSRLLCKGNTTISSSQSPSHAEVRDLPIVKDHTEVGASRQHITTSFIQPKSGLEEGADLKSQISGSLGTEQLGGFCNQVVSQVQSKAFVDSSQGSGLKEQAAVRTQFKAGYQEHGRVKSQTASQIPSKPASAVEEQTGQKSQRGYGSQLRSFPGVEDNVGVKDQPTSMTQVRTFPSKTKDVEVKFEGSSDHPQSKVSSCNFEVVTRKAELLAPQSQRRNVPGKLVEVGKKEEAPQSQRRNVPGKLEEVGKKEEASSSAEVKEEKEHSGLQVRKFNRQISAPGNNRDLQERKVDITPPSGNGLPVSTGRKGKELKEMFDLPSASSRKQVEVGRLSKGNQQLNDELQMKADELERLFTAHKLRINGDQMAPSWRSKQTETQVDHVSHAAEESLTEPIPGPLPERNTSRESVSNGVEFDATLLLKVIDNQEYVYNVQQKLGSPSKDYRGKFYGKYMQKRDAKLREEWGSKRAQKEAKMKAMHDSLELSLSEMKTKFSGSADKQNLPNAHRRAEKSRSFNSLTAKYKSQTVESLPEAEDEDPQELPRQVNYDGDKPYSYSQYSDGSSRISNSKKLLSSKTVSSTTRTPAAPVPRLSVKGTNSGSIWRRTQSENPLTQSVPNFSNLPKENTKALSGLSKITTRAQSRNLSRSKNTAEEENLAKEDKPGRFRSLRKISDGSDELMGLSPLYSDSVNLVPLRSSKEQPELVVFNKIQKSSESKTFIRKGNGVGLGSGAAIAKQKAFMTSENLKNGVEPQGLVNKQEALPDMDKDDDNFERISSEGKHMFMDFPADSDTEKTRLSKESGNSDELESENDDVCRLPSQVDNDLASISLKLASSEINIQESPEDSPAYWNSFVHHSFPYTQEASDADASVNSPSGSPASWNSHPMNHMIEADAARMRKKWGSAQIPLLGANAALQTRKDVTKGFKRLLKFGRKSKGHESLVTDYVSASTASEGDDDTEDGRDMSTRPSEDFRKSRMGHSHAAYDGFNDGEIFPEQVQSSPSSFPTPPANFNFRDDHVSGSSIKVPRSFFSLSPFRSKGNESKLR